MHTSSRRLRGALGGAVLALLAALGLLLASCGGEEGASGAGGDASDGGVSDGGDGDSGDSDAAEGSDAAAGEDAAPDAPPEGRGLCAPCEGDDVCGGAGDLCLSFPYGQGGRCGVGCAGAPEACPAGTFCATLQEEPLIQQCVPDLLLCENPCDALQCGDGEVCHPATGRCAPPLGSCEGPCLVDSECGGAQDRCLTLPDDDEAICALACAEDGACPDGSFCATVGEPEEGVRLCVPEALTCEARCEGVACGPGEACDPRSGACAPRLGLCDGGCEISALCGFGPDDLCISLGTPDDETICATGCDTSQECPLDYFCAGLEGRARGVCIPLEITCRQDRCEGVTCGAEANCDPRTGGCVEREASLCDPCESGESITCGGPADLCLDLGEGVGLTCTADCTLEGSCPAGFTCAQLNNSTRRACIPTGGDCRLCQGVRCDDGGTCNPLTGACEAPARSCLEAPCASGEICNPDNGLCEVIDAPCTFNTRVEDCFGPVRKCSATRPNSAGVCALLCEDDDACGAASPACLDLYRVGRLCAPPALGGAPGCGVSALADADLGRPCGSGVTARCAGDAPLCLEGVEAGVPGLCTRTCESDAACGPDAVCQRVRGRAERLCLPSSCRCLAGAAVPLGARDLLGEALAALGANHCTFGLPTVDRGVLPEAVLRAPFALAPLDAWISQPLGALVEARTFQEALAQALDPAAPSPQRALVLQAARLGLRLEVREPVWALPDGVHPVEAGLRRLSEAAGGAWSPASLQGDLLTLPADQAPGIGAILYALAALVEARRDLLASLDLDAAGVEALYDALPSLVLPGAPSAPRLSDDDLLRLQRLDLTPLLQATADLLATIQRADLHADPAWEGVSVRYASPAGRVILGGAGPTTWDPAQDPDLASPLALLIDPSGDDLYHIPAGANASPQHPAALLIDLDGDDTYAYTEAPSPLDTPAWLPSDADGRRTPDGPPIRYDGPVSLSDTPRQGAGRLGVGLLLDRGQGSDTYRSLRMSQGAALLGAGLLIDEGGDDDYASEALSQGAALLGVGLLLDLGAAPQPNTLRAWHRAQGHGAPGGAALLALTSGGDDTLTAEPGTGPADVLYWSPDDRSLSNLNLAQGVGAGAAPPDERAPERRSVAGGLGVLYDRGGDDRYTAGTWAQGAALHRGAGLLLDAGGADRYACRFGAQGAADTVAIGILIDLAGDDRYGLDAARLLGATQGSGLNLAAGIALDLAGDDLRALPAFSGGAGRDNGLGAVLDLDGADTWQARAASTLGAANLTPEAAAAQRAHLPTWGLLIDAGEAPDTWQRADLTGAPDDLIGGGRAWRQPAASDANERGSGLDGDGATGYEPE